MAPMGAEVTTSVEQKSRSEQLTQHSITHPKGERGLGVLEDSMCNALTRGILAAAGLLNTLVLIFSLT